MIDNQDLYCHYSGLPAPSSYLQQENRKRRIKRKHWNRCDICGKFISYKNFGNKTATRKLIYPDSDLSVEEYSTLCHKCSNQ